MGGIGSGGRRVGAGRPRLSLVEHLRRGSYRRDRHGALPPVVDGSTALDALPAAEWTPRPGDVARLGPEARDWLEAMRHEYVFNEVEGRELLLAAASRARIARLERAARRAGMCTAAGRRLLANLQAETRVFLALRRGLGLPGADHHA